MLYLTTDQIIELIQGEDVFEANCEDSFSIKIQEYAPFICAAIHNGHNLRKELEDKILLSDTERLYEESPYTQDFIQSLPITIIGNDSRYEYDLNRPEDKCIHNIAWGKQIWKEEPSIADRNTSLEKHRSFYKVVHALVQKLEQKFKAVIIYDIHSYNYKRHSETYLFNIGIENIDIRKYNRQLSQWKEELLKIKINGQKAEVSVNHIFHGRGYLLKYIQDNFDNTLVLATEVKKIYMDELTGQKYPLIIKSLAKELKKAIINNTQKYINELSNINIKKKGKLLHGDLQPELKKIDNALQKYASRFQLLNYVNPLNLASAKKKFFKSKFSVNPEFRYKPLTIDPFKFKSDVYSLKIDAIEDIHLRQLYIDIIGSYSDKADLLSSLGTNKFLYNSMRYFGEPTDKDIDNAKFLLYCQELPEFEDEPLLELSEIKEKFIEEGNHYGFSFKIIESSTIPSDALVMNAKKTLVLKKGARFKPSRLTALANHEIGVHMVTTMNGQEQPLKLLKLGLPRNTYTQEGLAVMSEMLSGSLTINRLKTLGLRVLAVKSLVNGNDFKTTFQYLYETYKVDPEHLFNLVTRIYRGGGFTKDYLYLSGFRNILELHKKGVKLDNLFLGKTSVNYLATLNEMVDRGILNPPSHIPKAFKEPVTTSPVLEYLTNSLI
ncbi:flavohemoglobin expression-modulating QEGLA motif protein [Aureibacter tunicatorum]|uniref:Uncharacterized protein (TIGR02421 family) n=1 Tax=Aureibacter tunicatorum TaxID=866807 RepID=A0AAE3XKY9_9BACT|nr:flavohemoglobin expression-modulating QEGLA motif protein [Aureibacter tunicatorum]MDR6237840.1 uncharacterized protein (TIGR02421 family) [Aureibacter tunicatorum]BDD02875.1 N-formylglutamate amidohydrolase [Aureibacter tunicatorum]